MSALSRMAPSTATATATTTTTNGTLVSAYLGLIVIVASCLISIFALYALIQIVVRRKQQARDRFNENGEHQQRNCTNDGQASGFQGAKCAWCQRRASTGEFEPNNMACKCSTSSNKQQFNVQGKVIMETNENDIEAENEIRAENLNKIEKESDSCVINGLNDIQRDREINRQCEGNQQTIESHDLDANCSLDTVIDLRATDNITKNQATNCNVNNYHVNRTSNENNNNNCSQEETFESIGQSSLSDYEDSMNKANENVNIINKKWSKIVNKVSLLRKAAKLISGRGEDDDSDGEDDFLTRKLALVESQSNRSSFNRRIANNQQFISDNSEQQHNQLDEQEVDIEPEYLSSQRLRCSEISM